MKYITNARLLTLGLSLFLGTFLSAQDNTVFDKKQFEQNLQKAQELTAENKMKEAMVYLEKADKTMYSKNAAHPIEATKLTLAFGDWYLSNGNIKTAEDTYKWSLLSAESAPKSAPQRNPLLADAQRGLARVELSKGNYAKSEEFSRKALGVNDGSRRSQGSLLNLVDLGLVYKAKLQTPLAIKSFEQAKEQSQKLPNQNTKEIAMVYYRLGEAYLEGGKSQKALENLRVAQQICDKIGKEGTSVKASVMQCLGETHISLENNEEALRNHAVAVAAFGEDAPNAVKSLLRMGKIFSVLKTDEVSELAYNQSLGTSRALVPKVDAVLSAEQIKNIASKARAKNIAFSVSCYDRAEVMAQKINANKVVYEIEILMGRGRIHFELQDLGKAKANYEKAYALVKGVYPAKHPVSSECQLALGKIYLAESQLETSLQYIEQSLNATLASGADVGGKKLPDLGKAKFPYELLNSMTAKGQVYTAQAGNNDGQKLEDALAYFDKAYELVQKLRRRHRSQGQRYELAKMSKALSNQAVKAAYGLYQKTGNQKYLYKAFDFCENAKSTLLLDALRDLEARKVAGVSEEILNKEQKLKVELAYFGEEIYYELKQGAKRNDNRLTTLEIKKDSVGKVYDALITEIEKKYPKYYELKYKNGTVPLTEIQQLLASGQTLVEYLEADSTVYIFIATKEKADMVAVPLKEKLNDLVLPFMVALKGNDFDAFVKYSTIIHDLLWKPVAQRLGNTKSLLVVPDAHLNYISFELLLTKKPANLNGDYRQLPILLRDYPICYNYSASLFAQSKKIAKGLQPMDGFMGIAPDFAKMDFGALRNKMEKKDDTSSVFSALPEAVKEVQTISKFLGGQEFTGKDAGEGRFKKEVNKHSIIHLATHTVVNNSNPLFSKIILDPDGDNDGLLHTYELYGLDLNAEMVTLSTCNSGIGSIQEGEGVMSIARGFSYAGVPNVVMSLWPVPDATTGELMHSFYGYLRQGYNKDQALQRAKIDFIDKASRLTGAPFFWGGFVIAGNEDAMDMPHLHIDRPFPWLWAGIGGGSLLLLGLGAWMWSRRRTA